MISRNNRFKRGSRIFRGLLLLAVGFFTISSFATSTPGLDIGGEVSPRLVIGDEPLNQRTVRKRNLKKKKKSRKSSEQTVRGKYYSKSKAAYLAQNQPSAAERLDPAQSTSMVTPEEEDKQKSKTSVTVGASHNGGYYEDREQTTSIFASLTYKFNKKQSASIAQSFNQGYRVNPGVDDRGFKQNDTVLGFNQSIAEDFLTANWSGKLSTTLPISERSNRLDTITVTTLSFSASRSFLDKKLSASLTPMGRYYFSEYTTTPSSPGAGGGNPLPEYMLGIQASLTYSVSDQFSVNGGAGWTTTYYYQTQYENPDPIYGFTNPPKNSYSLSLGANYSITPKWGASLTYAHSDRYEKPWGTEYLIFNDRITTWSVGTSYTF